MFVVGLGRDPAHLCWSVLFSRNVPRAGSMTQKRRDAASATNNLIASWVVLAGFVLYCNPHQARLAVGTNPATKATCDIIPRMHQLTHAYGC
jgi:hypothetical protein